MINDDDDDDDDDDEDDDDDDDDDDEKYYYYGVKNKLELYSSEWLRSKKEAIINGDNCFQNALNDALDHQRIKKDLQKISN